ncbi:MAG: hypothetical protein GEU71_18345 [Actinobacteria bacterium]|nr:hypothetical protein [Actinomycetota bacterium]
MRQKTSVTLAPETIQAVDDLAGTTSNRSRIIEQAVHEFLQRRKREIRDAQDLEILNETAEKLNEETSDVLDYQAQP